MEEVVTTVASEAAEPLLDLVRRQCGYVIFTNSYVGQLDKILEKLDDVRVEVQRSVDHADNNMWEIKREVNRWKNNAETVANEARSLLDNDGRAKKTCFCGWLPNPKERHCLGRDASKTVQAIQLLIPQGKFEKVYYESAPPALVGGATEVNLSASNGGDTITDSRASIFQDIMKALDDEKLKVIGVYGPGGVGKTTLLEEIEKKLRKEGRPFHMIVKAKVLQIPVLKNIQDEIADALKLDLKDVQSESGRGNRLLERLQKDPSEKVLIILDDLWEELDLKAVGIPLVNTSGKCKLLLTSRFKHVLEQKMRADRTFLLEGLNNDEAFGLFEKTVGDRLKDEEELRPIAAQVVEKLAGLPLLIISVASTLKNSGMSAWKNALIKIDVKKMETIVKLSYDRLESEDAKSLFLLCGLIGGTIKVELLLGLGMGLGLFEGFNNMIEDSRDRLNTTLESLRSICLLQDGRDDMENVTIHDLYSEVVVSTPFRGQGSLMMNNDYGSWSKEKLEKCWAICLAKLGRDRLAELMTCQFPDMKILMLSQPEDWWWMPGHKHDGEECWGQLEFTCMKEIRVLYLRSRLISTLPSSIEFLGNLHSLYLDQCDVADVRILGKLKALQILSFAQSTISRLPKEIGELINLKSLNLSNCYTLKTIEPGTLKGLIKLEELYMKESFDRWMGTNEIPSDSCNARLAELKSLARLTTLEISIPDPTILFKDGDLPFGNLIRFWINIGNVEGREFLGLRTMKLKLEGCDSIISRDWVQKTLQKTQFLHLDGLGEFKKNAHELCIRGFTQLKHLHIQNSPSIKYIASSSSDLPTAFTILESLSLENLINLEKLCNGPVAPNCFSKLKAMHIKKCHRLENLWFLSKMQRLVYLEEIQICECDSLLAIITYDAGKVEVAANDIVQLPDVCHLDLRKLPNMTSFCTEAKGAPIQVRFPNLEELCIGGVQCKELWNNQISNDSFCKLKFLMLKGCDNLQHIAPSHMWKRLQDCLETLEVKSCRSIEIIYESDGTVAKSGNLRALDLRDLDNLRHIWRYSNLPKIPFPNLRYIKAVRCSRLDMLFATFTAKFLGQIEELVVGSCEDMEQIASHEECEEVTGKTITFSRLTTLRIYNLPKFKSFLPEKYSAEFPSLDVSSRIEPDQGNRSAEESEEEIEELDREIEGQSEGK
ncbi:hypothetical protein EUGRSUZ_G00512 [Eucalyptus grandis]|uniref:Uncharacterized protein n=2 Tax=Eucalyptus grandis TaxID=71139 RepID=A0ACC3K1I1_EUCGR|nr:hypothetical protein EUGRSUZ_G00512 [Eucalyptus grandis]